MDWNSLDKHPRLPPSYTARPYLLDKGSLRSCSRVLTFTWWGFYVLCLWHKPTELAHSFLFCSCICFCLYGPFNCISFHKLARQLSVLSLCSSGFISVLIVLSTVYLFIKLPQPGYNPLWLTRLKTPINQLNNWLHTALSLANSSRVP